MKSLRLIFGDQLSQENLLIRVERIDEDTIYFIIRVLNQLDIDFVRNRILLKVLPLKV